MPGWTAKRAKRLIRDSKGRFKRWTGGKPDKRNSTRRGMNIHLTSDFKKQEGRKPRVGDIHRKRNLDGSYHGQSMFYVRTPFGWRRSNTEQRKPTQAQIKRQIETSRKN